MASVPGSRFASAMMSRRDLPLSDGAAARMNGEPGHRHDILLRVIGHLLAHGEIGAEGARSAEPDGVAVGRRFRDRIDPDHGARTGLVLDHDRLLEDFGQLLPDQARENVVAAAGGEADDDPDRLVGIVRGGIALRRCRLGGNGDQRRERRRQQGAFETDHGRSSVGVYDRSVFLKRQAASSVAMPRCFRDCRSCRRLPPRAAV